MENNQTKEKETPVYSRDTQLVANDFNQFFSSVGRNAAQTAAQLPIDNNINISDTSLISPPMSYLKGPHHYGGS